MNDTAKVGTFSDICKFFYSFPRTFMRVHLTAFPMPNQNPRYCPFSAHLAHRTHFAGKHLSSVFHLIFGFILPHYGRFRPCR